MKTFLHFMVLGLLSACVTLVQAALPIQSWNTSSGARVLFVQADTIPMLDLQIDFDAGSRFDPPGKSGVAQFVQNLIGTGTPQLTEAQIEARQADLGAQMGGHAGMERASYSLRTLTDKAIRTQAVELFAQTLQTPTFPAEILRREQTRTIAALKEQSTKPDEIAERRFYALLYGDHPYARQPTAESVNRLTQSDLVQFYQQTHVAKRAVVSMIGAISRAEAEAIAERLTQGLPEGGAVLPTFPDPAITTAKVERIAHPAQQSHILIGTPALARGDPDFFALTVGNYILGGGGFVSRLMHEVRERRGLAYSVTSYFSPMLQRGPFVITLQTRREQTDNALKVVDQTLQTFLQQGPSAAELRAAKDNLRNGFALRIDNNHKILEHIALVGFYQLPLDYLDHWVENMERVTLADVRAAFARKVKREQLVTVVVGA